MKPKKDNSKQCCMNNDSRKHYIANNYWGHITDLLMLPDWMYRGCDFKFVNFTFTESRWSTYLWGIFRRFKERPNHYSSPNALRHGAASGSRLNKRQGD